MGLAIDGAIETETARRTVRIFTQPEYLRIGSRCSTVTTTLSGLRTPRQSDFSALSFQVPLMSCACIHPKHRVASIRRLVVSTLGASFRRSPLDGGSTTLETGPFDPSMSHISQATQEDSYQRWSSQCVLKAAA